MSSELLYTSAPQGLKGGSRGFTTVLCTAGMPPNLADKLESFSGYKHVYSPQDPLAEHNPVRFAYLRPNVGGRSVTVVSRLAAYGVDYSGRSNKLAHHIVLEAEERPHGGPAWLLSQKDLWKASWNGECKTLNAGPRIPEGDKVAGVCRQWHEIAGDAGWGGQLVTWLKQSNKPIWLIYEPKQQGKVLELLGESFALLPEAERWKYTFATYFSGLPSDVDCRIRGVVTGSDEARLASARGHVIDLTHPVLLTTTLAWIEIARTGILPSTPLPLSAAPELPSGSDAVLGVREAPSLAEFMSEESPWRDEPQRMSETSLPVDLPHGVGGYQLAPPPMPTTRRSSQPPTLPNQKNGRDSSSSIFRWALPAAAAVVLLMILGAGGVYVLQNDPGRLSTAVVAKSSTAPEPEPSVPEKNATTAIEQNAPSEIAGKDAVAASSPPVNESPSSHDAENKEEKELARVFLWYGIGDSRKELATWQEGDNLNEFSISVPENHIGATDYEITATKDIALSINDQNLAIEDGRLLIKQKQNFELMKTKNIISTLTIGIGAQSFRIPINISISDVDEFVRIEPITRTFDISNQKSININVREIYGDRLVDVPDFDFAVEPDSKKHYGTLIKDGEHLKYELAETSGLIGENATDSFSYNIAFKGHDKQSGKVEFLLTGAKMASEGISISLTRTNGEYVEFDHVSIKTVFNKPATFELQIIGAGGRIGQVCELVMEKKGLGISNQIDKKKVWDGIGEVYFNPGKSRENDPKPKISFNEEALENEFARQVRNLFVEHIFRVCVRGIIQNNIDKIKKKITAIEMSGDSIQKKTADIEEHKGILRKYDSMLKRYSVYKRFDSFPVLSLLDRDRAKRELEQLVQEALKGCPEGEVKSEIQVCEEQVLDEYMKAKEFISQSRLVVKEVQEDGEVNGSSGPQSTKMQIPPLGN